ncbi:hypothetical protein F511_39084 [Dorcoceras hygrometricum]|uniref:CCHC-type domain-containing protein n=1 Tax=Dorcoceras hygrometricum TaxID=472368 RepID=A0A2Z7D3F4_9LAMI|nr:hypothetical protein F511_39084 [Dorcoceras hygrometricum]
MLTWQESAVALTWIRTSMLVKIPVAWSGDVVVLLKRSVLDISWWSRYTFTVEESVALLFPAAGSAMPAGWVLSIVDWFCRWSCSCCCQLVSTRYLGSLVVVIVLRIKIRPIDSVSKTECYDLKNRFSEPQCKMTVLPLNSGKPRTCVTLNGSGIQLVVGPQPLWLRDHNSGLAHRIMVKRLATSPHDPLGITDSACKNQSVVVSVQYGPFNPYIPIISTTIGKSRVAMDPIAMHTSWRSNSDIAVRVDAQLANFWRGLRSRRARRQQVAQGGRPAIQGAQSMQSSLSAHQPQQQQQPQVAQQSGRQRFRPHSQQFKKKSGSGSSGSGSSSSSGSRAEFCGYCGGKHPSTQCVGVQGSCQICGQFGHSARVCPSAGSQ